MGTNAESLKIRVAVPEEADAISELAIRSKTHWNYAHVYFDDRVTWTSTDDELPRLGGKTGLEPI